MPEFQVSWSIDIDADDPREAAEIAETSYMKAKGARVYEVRQWEPLSVGNGGVLPETAVTIDLDEEPGGETDDSES